MIIARISSGLGNQLFQYATARAVSLRLGAPLYLDRSKFGPHEPYECELPRFRIAGRMAGRLTTALARHGQDDPDAAGTLRRRAAAAVARTAFTRVVDRQAGYDPRLATVRGNVILSGHWETEKYFVEHRPLLRRELTLRDAPDPENRSLLNEIAACPAVVVHVRRGDREHVPALRAFHGLCPLSYYEEAAEYVRRRCPGAVYFVFTNDPEWATRNVKLPGPVRMVTHNLRRRDYEDLRLMRACHHFILANSTFSWWGAWLADRPDKIVVAPKRWFAVDHASATDLCPADWVRL